MNSPCIWGTYNPTPFHLLVLATAVSAIRIECKTNEEAQTLWKLLPDDIGDSPWSHARLMPPYHCDMMANTEAIPANNPSRMSAVRTPARIDITEISRRANPDYIEKHTRRSTPRRTILTALTLWQRIKKQAEEWNSLGLPWGADMNPREIYLQTPRL